MEVAKNNNNNENIVEKTRNKKNKSLYVYMTLICHIKDFLKDFYLYTMRKSEQCEMRVANE